MIGYTTQASWVLITAFTVSALYELFRSTTKAGTSKYDSTRRFLTQAVPGYAAAFALAVLVRTGWPWVTWTGLLVAVALIGVSILYSGPIMLPHRQPGPIDWLEDKLSTGLLFVAVTLLLDDLLGKTLTPQATRWPSGRAHCVRDEDHRGPPSRRWLQWDRPGCCGRGNGQRRTPDCLGGCRGEGDRSCPVIGT